MTYLDVVLTVRHKEICFKESFAYFCLSCSMFLKKKIYCILKHFLYYKSIGWYGLPLSGKEFACQCHRLRLNPWVGKISWRRKWRPTPVFLPGEFHGQRSMAGYSPWGNKRVGHNLATT